MFRHVVMLRFADGTDESVKSGAVEGIRRLRDDIDAVRAVSAGLNEGEREDNFDLVGVVDFDDVEGFRTYSSHPAHLAFVDGVKPHLAGRAAAQYIVE